ALAPRGQLRRETGGTGHGCGVARRRHRPRGHRACLPRATNARAGRGARTGGGTAMTWLLWRQHRNQVFITGGVPVAVAIAVAITSHSMANSYRAALQSCGGHTDGCPILGGLFNGDGFIIDVVHLTIVVPLLLGLFVGATLIGRETEQ